MELCESCHHEKENNDMTLCFYCYHRGNESTMKMTILNILKNSLNRLNKNDIMENLNTLPYIGYEMKLKDMEMLLWRYKDLGLITGRKTNIKGPEQGGRRLLLYKITIKGEKWLSRANKRWKNGEPIHVPRRNKKESKFKMTSEYRERASSIRGLIGKSEDYELYAYIFPRRRKL